MHDDHAMSLQELIELIGTSEGKKAAGKENKRVSSYETLPLFSSLSTLAEYGARLQQLKLREVGPAEQRDMPTLQFSYGVVPIVLCSAGIKRIVALAYLLVWAWNEHVINSQLIREEPQRSIVLLIDEMEAHLHPFWQRMIVPAIMKVVQALSEEVGTQIIIATHSPLVLASVEPLFDEGIDALFHLYQDCKDGSVQLQHVPFVKRGRIDQWLISDIFGLEQPRSLSAEQVIEIANRLQLEDDVSKKEVQEVHDQLVKILVPDDEFWPLWTYFAQTRGVSLDAD